LCDLAALLRGRRADDVGLAEAARASTLDVCG
jgi:hypothetical protein